MVPFVPAFEAEVGCYVLRPCGYGLSNVFLARLVLSSFGPSPRPKFGPSPHGSIPRDPRRANLAECPVLGAWFIDPASIKGLMRHWIATPVRRRDRRPLFS